MVTDIHNLYTECAVCQKLRAPRVYSSDMASTAANAPCESVFIDYFGPVREEKGFKYILVMLDRFSRFVVYVPTRDVTCETTVREIIDRWMCMFGVPKMITTSYCERPALLIFEMK